MDSENRTTKNNTEAGSKSKWYLISLLLFQQALGGMTFPIAKFGLTTIEPFTFAFYRFLLATLVLLGITRIRPKDPPVQKKDYLKILGLGFLVIPFNQVAYLYGQKLTGAGHGALLFSTVPIWFFLGGLVFFKEKFILRRGVGVLLGLAGAAIIMASGAIKLGPDYLLGDLIILTAVWAWVAYTLLGRPLVMKYGAFRVTAYALASGSALYLPFGLYRAMVFDYSSTTPGAWWSVVYVALGVSVTAYVIWYWLVKQMAVTRIAVFQNLQPVIASGAAYIFLGEPIGWPFILGGAVVLTGVLITEL